MGIYVGKSGSKKEADVLYIGKSGSKKEVSEAYAYKNGTVAQVYSAIKHGTVVFTTSGTFTVPKGITSIDAFCVGGGAQGGAGGGYTGTYSYGSPGGCGGFTSTVKGISVNPGDDVPVVVGGAAKYKASIYGGTGGTSSVLDCKASGGDTPVYYSDDSIKSSFYGIYGSTWRLGKGGSGGGGLGWWNSSDSSSYYENGGNGGSNGSDGGKGWGNSGESPHSSYYGVGQGSTTRAFGESSGTLYAGGGAGYSMEYNKRGTAGAGGGGDVYYSGASGTGGGCGASGSKGGSGCVIVRWGY